MNILWITNIIMPEAEALMTSSTVLKASGGWMVGLASQLVKNNNICLTIATVSKRVSTIKRLQGENITYYILPLKSYETCWLSVRDDVKPDVIHLHGTEYPWGKSYVDTCGPEHVVVSIQGMLSAYYYYYYYYGLSAWTFIRNATIGSILFGGTLKGKHNFKRDSKREIALLQKVHHVIGRTSWDRAHTWAINPDAKYHFCNEILRQEFFDGSKWEYDKCSKHTIFLSQSTYPIKGLHQILKAMPLILRHYPNAKVRIAGGDITQRKGLHGFLLYSDFANYISKTIKRLQLTEHIIFTGPLDAEGMKREYLNANVFVCPSTIENSPNSLGEAQILGVPCISSYVGGMSDMIPNGDCGIMYRFEEINMLAKAVCDTFAKSEFSGQQHMIEIANQRHNPVKNAIDLESIYKEVAAK